ncbi:bacteriocin-associated integral membrane family protein [Staphylococcus aureus]|uniref:bacteriocin-associated integral membrane family protein n=1 Tax=Staphylococcus aureus TaxID=1280 RepID=UPI0038B3DAA5
MKWFKLILDVTTFILIAILLFVYTYKENEEILPDTKYPIAVTDWNKKYSKNEIYKRINQFAKNENVAIYKSTSNYTNKNVDKDIYVFNKSKATTITPFNAKYNIHYLSDDELLKKDIKGSYFVKDKNFDVSKFINFLKEYGVTAESYKIDHMMIAVGVIKQMNIEVPLSALLIVYFIYYIFEKNINFKAYAIKYLNGFTLRKIIFENFSKKCTYWVTLIISQILLTTSVLWILNYTGNLDLFILRLVLLSCLFILTISVIKDLNKIKETEKYWNVLDDYYTIEFAPYHETKQSLIDNMLRSEQLVKASEAENNAILFKPKGDSVDNDNFSPDEGNVILVNNQFWSIYYKQFQPDIPIKNQKNNVEVIIPQKFHAMRNEINQAYHSWFEFVQNKNNKENKLSIQFINKNDYRIFSFDARDSRHLSFIEAPIIVNVQASDLSNDFYYAMISQGGYLFKNYDALVKNIEKYHLDGEISGITNYKDSVMEMYHENNLKLTVLNFSQIIIAIILIIIILFDVKYYFEQHRKLLVIKKLYGYSTLRANYQYLLINNIVVVFIGILTNVILHSQYIMMIFATILVVQILLQICSLYYHGRRFNEVIKEF